MSKPKLWPIVNGGSKTRRVAVGAISIGAFRGRNTGVGAVFGRLSEPVDLLFEFGRPRLQLQDDLDKLGLGELL